MNVNSFRNLSLAALPFVLSGCHQVLLGNVFVLSISVGIFFGTLGLGRATGTRTATRSSDGSADQSRR